MNFAIKAMLLDFKAIYMDFYGHILSSGIGLTLGPFLYPVGRVLGWFWVAVWLLLSHRPGNPVWGVRRKEKEYTQISMLQASEMMMWNNGSYYETYQGLTKQCAQPRNLLHGFLHRGLGGRIFCNGDAVDTNNYCLELTWLLNFFLLKFTCEKTKTIV